MKKKIYIALTILLVFLLGFIAFLLVESAYAKKLVSIGQMAPAVYSPGIIWCAFPFWVKSIFILVGVIDGYFLGQFWWRVVYIEKKHWRDRKKKVIKKPTKKKITKKVVKKK